MKLIVLDLEFTCWNYRPPSPNRKEIIEIGIAVVDTLKERILKSESIIIKPKYSKIGKFCTKLTSLTQDYVMEKGIPFDVACHRLLEDYDSDLIPWASYGGEDLKQFKEQCRDEKIDYPMHERHYDLAVFAQRVWDSRDSIGLQNLLNLFKMEFIGNPHRGGDDAINTARVLFQLLKKHEENQKKANRFKTKE